MFVILNKQTCSLPLRQWLYLMLVHDSLNLCLQYTIIAINSMQFGVFRGSSTRNQNTQNAPPAQQDLPDLEQAINMEGEDPLQELQNSIHMMRTGLSPVEARNGWIQCCKLIVWMLEFLITLGCTFSYSFGVIL